MGGWMDELEEFGVNLFGKHKVAIEDFVLNVVNLTKTGQKKTPIQS